MKKLAILSAIALIISQYTYAFAQNTNNNEVPDAATEQTLKHHNAEEQASTEHADSLNIAIAPVVMQTLPGEENFSALLEMIPETCEIKPGPRMTLSQALLAADAQNLDLQAAHTKLEIAEAKLKQAWAIALPNISGTVQWAHLGKTPEAEIMGMKIPLASADSVTASLTFGMNLINVASWIRLHMASEASKVTALGIEQGRQALLAGVAQTYLAALMTGEVVKIQHEQLSSALERLDLTQKRLEAGVGVRLDLIQAQFNVENNRQALIDAIWNYEGARDALAGITNSEGLPVPVPVPLAAVENFDDELIITEALQQNREMQVTRATMRLQELQRRATIADFYPSLTGAWVANYSLTKPAGMGSTDRLSWTLALNLSIPLFDYSKFGALDEQKAALKESELSLQRIELNTKLAVRKAKREYFSTVLAVDNAKRQVELAAEAMALTEAAYKNGAATFIDLSDAQRNFTQANIGYVAKTIQAQLSLIALKAALGRDIMANVF
ncbi:MAG: TolC family protein [Bradymonadales bacterium]|jgi:outer membrane protein TolC